MVGTKIKEVDLSGRGQKSASTGAAGVSTTEKDLSKKDRKPAKGSPGVDVKEVDLTKKSK